MQKKIFTKQEVENMIDLYQNQHKTLQQIGENFNVSRTVISRIFKENNISTSNKQRKYYAQYDIFEQIDSKEKAYWLGFIAADGCVYKRQESAGGGDTLVINISAKDQELLEQLKIFMKSNANIINHVQNAGFSNNSQMVKINFNSKKIVSDLINKGIVPNKSLVLKPPLIEKKYFLSFILGYFDGDGSIFKFNEGKEFGFNIEGTKEILNWILETLKINLPLEKRYDDGKNNYYIRCGGINKPYEILKQLYDNHGNLYCLSRKKELFQELSTVVLSRNTK